MRLSEEQIKTLQECGSAEEVMAAAKASGVEISEEEATQLFESYQFESLNEEDLDAVSGGCGTPISQQLCFYCRQPIGDEEYGFLTGSARGCVAHKRCYN